MGDIITTMTSNHITYLRDIFDTSTLEGRGYHREEATMDLKLTGHFDLRAETHDWHLGTILGNGTSKGALPCEGNDEILGQTNMGVMRGGWMMGWWWITFGQLGGGGGTMR